MSPCGGDIKNKENLAVGVELCATGFGTTPAI